LYVDVRLTHLSLLGYVVLRLVDPDAVVRLETPVRAPLPFRRQRGFAPALVRYFPALSLTNRGK
jgi:hypothetical protein